MKLLIINEAKDLNKKQTLHFMIQMCLMENEMFLLIAEKKKLKSRPPSSIDWNLHSITMWWRFQIYCTHIKNPLIGLRFSFESQTFLIEKQDGNSNCIIYSIEIPCPINANRRYTSNISSQLPTNYGWLIVGPSTFQNFKRFLANLCWKWMFHHPMRCFISAMFLNKK